MTGAPDVEVSPEALLALGAATLGESGGRPMAPRIAAAWPGAAVAGPAYPVRCSPGDNLAIHAATAKAPAGSVLVVTVGFNPDAAPDDDAVRGYWGEVLTTGAQARGIAGLVIDGGVRDRDALEAHRFPVFAAQIALRGATKNQRGTVNAAVDVGGVTVQVGDWVVGDADGVVVIPGDDLGAALAAGNQRAAKEEGYFTALRGGTTTVDLLGLDLGPITDG
jgi:4-hydroxy-4-methyl-2-oxoglutarate aldolase